ncbi:hormogonium polysaccharide biosynthesis protein HpsA [Synechococcus sp. Nb3U1]|uniref:hormogonium polysaccharide biosynthesis protein HpsA n=1 Tax=Synechococcus sp. Nb3U1 TaxID=1914529 RepID=UPI001F4226BE|nr:hormogonium polysaccharide biosynthesis protein HpsA [Synechococcus sp. Nb3U1]MCF2972276.1 hormogonium polysaccharide biosynthesis protein HpsA [Synechococcus sp. Nb3U1]
MPAPSTLLLKLTLRLLGSLKARVDKSKIRQRGFVLPIAILIVLVLSLVTVGLLTRSTQRSVQTQVERAGQTVSRQLNAAIDRARAKIEFLVRDPRLPNSAPTDAQLSSALINDGVLIPENTNNPYILPDENQFVITTDIQVEDPNNPGEFLNVPVRAPAWWFLVDTDNNGINDSTTVYTILSTRRAAGNDFEDNLTDTERARRLMIRSGPLQGAALEGCNDSPTAQTVNPNVGDWFQLGSALYKPFQVYAVTLPIQGADSTTRAISALQFQQDRRRDVLNKWGAFSRGDMEFYNTPGYNWNGAIYAGGSLFYRYNASTLFRAFTISSEGSCFYLPVDNSEIKTFGELVAGAIGFAGQAASDNIRFDAHPGFIGVVPGFFPSLNNQNFDSVANSAEPENVALDPLELYLFGRNRNRGTYAQDQASWNTSPVNSKRSPAAGNPGRVEAGGFAFGGSQVCPPYVDDVYRADSRFGPKASYDRPPTTPDPVTGCDVDTFAETFGQTAGALIGGGAVNNQGESLTTDNPPPGALTEVGLDGYWERRSRLEGLRVIVGQRLELTRTDSLPLPLVPTPANADDPSNLQPIFISNEARQRLTLRDNPASVQATAIYHYSQNDGRFPVACLATVAHPGSVDSLRRASTFPTGNQATQLGINFFTGQGTNTWEYDPAPMQARLESGTPLWNALTNLANFAGDPQGAFPPTQEPGRIHPDPFMTAFGNFSELRRIIDSGVAYANLSLADQTTVQTAGCMLGMLADNIIRIENAAAAGDGSAQRLLSEINDSRNGLPINNGSHRFYLPLRYIFPTASFDQTDALEQQRRAAYSFLPATVSYLAVTDLAQVALTPRAGINNWALPHAQQNCPDGSAGIEPGPNSNQFDLIRIGTQCHRVPFKDSVFYDGREAMAVRNLNIDLALITNNVDGQSNGLISGDTWLPSGIPVAGQPDREGGILYAFREDALREDAIARPALGGFAGYLANWQASTANGVLGSTGVMNAGQPGRGVANGQTVWDPPISNVAPDNTGLSPKPVDYFADPDRRPYGFRLRNGAVLRRGGLDADEAVFGMSFISDNPVYIQGNFNLHQDANGNRLEEFDELLTFGGDGLYNNFYGREREDENPNFARAVGDLWRATDVLGDSVNILSANFCDGSIEDGFIQDGTLNGGGSNFVADRDYQSGRASSPRRNQYYGCTEPNLGANTSFINQALVRRGNNWPANDPNDIEAGVRRFDNTNGVQELGLNTTRPGHPEVFSRDTVTTSFDGTNDNSLGLGNGRGGGINRNLRPTDPGYASFGTRISALGHPVVDTSRWLQVAAQGRCPIPNGSGLLAEYYNGWLTNPASSATLYNRATSFTGAGSTTSALMTVPGVNLGYLRAVRWPDTVYRAQGVPDAINTQACDLTGTNNNGNWGCIKDAVVAGNTTASVGPFARSGGAFPNWGGFQFVFGNINSLDSNSPFKRRLYNNVACNGSLLDGLNPLCLNTDAGRFFWIPSCTETESLPSVPLAGFDDAADIAPDITDPGQFNFLRSCWRRRNVSGTGNQQGNNFFVVRWVGELFPVFPGQVDYRVTTDDGVRFSIRSNPDYYANPANDLTVPTITVSTQESWGGPTEQTISPTLQCSPNPNQSPYLIEVQMNENTGNAFARLSTRPKGAPDSSLEFYDLRYLKPVKPVNFPCVPNPVDKLTFNDPPLKNQARCTTDCITITLKNTTPACPEAPDRCGQVLTGEITKQTICPDPKDPNNKIWTTPNSVTCNIINNWGNFSNWEPPCTVANGGTKVTQTRSRKGVTTCKDTPISETQTQNVTCPPVCNYTNFSDWSPACPTLACDETLDINQTRTRTLIAGTSSPQGCKPTDTESKPITCYGPPCGPKVFAPPGYNPNSPFGTPNTVASRPSTIELRPVWEVEADPDPETISVASVQVPEVASAATLHIQSDANQLTQGSEQPSFKWPSLGQVVGSVFDWVFGEPAYAARRGIPTGLPTAISNPQRDPGIRPAEKPAQPLPSPLAGKGTDARAIQLRSTFMGCPEDTPSGIDGGFWVPGVFRPNFNTTFKYTGYTGDSRPSTLRFDDLNGDDQLNYLDANANGVFDAGDTLETIIDRDPLFAYNFNGNLKANNFPNLSNPVDIHPQMRLNPYARVRDNNDQSYNNPAGSNITYLDGYYVDDVGPDDAIRNGLCFYVRGNGVGGQAEIQIDRNGNSDGGLAWVAVEALTLDLNANSTGFGGTNPILGVVLDEVSRRPIPIPLYQGLTTEPRRRDNTGATNYQLQPAVESRVNTIAISGIVPSRQLQPNGGIPNFLRLNELWTGQNLFFSGSMIQLNYSTYSTGPFLQQSFEPPDRVTPDAAGVQGFDYYFPPNRRFGYDVGLQIARRFSPVSARFQFPSNTRTEFLRELDPQDPYVRRLRCALQDQTGVTLEGAAQIGGCGEFN